MPSVQKLTRTIPRDNESEKLEKMETSEPNVPSIGYIRRKKTLLCLGSSSRRFRSSTSYTRKKRVFMYFRSVFIPLCQQKLVQIVINNLSIVLFFLDFRHIGILAIFALQ